MTNGVASPWFIDNTHMLLRMGLALLLGGLIGFEREQSNHAAGLRTNTLVCLGSCLLMMLSMYGFGDFANETNVRLDPARLAAQVITGIGFLGAGTILFTGKSITGLTTAASLWVVSAIGLAVGAGFYLAAVTATGSVYFILWAMNKIEKRFLKGKREQMIRIYADDRSTLLQAINAIIQEQDIVVRKMTVSDQTDIHEGRVMVQMYVTLPKQLSIMLLVNEINDVGGVRGVSAE
ncbi:putative Mg2+ transporter-C (MgtC) family protein [Paenibacillus cellulosilyticus]|uniref:Putative Mg2+ transporter-C (MgtC) family protein n=1 Tax=Paenibacillus cellulosilyticus TaxID=375489 RepID=A0A2V2YNS7_9BACL|nr:MgtC/SapB family protein [Paenibacillus cellulosilyticus]PWV95598.1 putative Mg2+ transporter-C (MgtC) family protein [Paenibacillus cellulosilyticus]QKS48785.1 MgtC/SapB family protein [Paenibacillus cellulosilyticus]